MTRDEIERMKRETVAQCERFFLEPNEASQSLSVDTILDLYNMALRCLNYDERLTAVMPSDMKDWHKNNRDEWPEVAAMVINDLRSRRDESEAQLDAVLFGQGGSR